MWLGLGGTHGVLGDGRLAQQANRAPSALPRLHCVQPEVFMDCDGRCCHVAEVSSSGLEALGAAALAPGWQHSHRHCCGRIHWQLICLRCSGSPHGTAPAAGGLGLACRGGGRWRNPQGLGLIEIAVHAIDAASSCASAAAAPTAAGPRRGGIPLAQARQAPAAGHERPQRRPCCRHKHRGGQPVCGAAGVDVRGWRGGRRRRRGSGQRAGRRHAGQAVLPQVSRYCGAGAAVAAHRSTACPACLGFMHAPVQPRLPTCTNTACAAGLPLCRCQARLGSFNWAGTQSSDGAWVTPAFQVLLSGSAAHRQ